jgi:hypothetical protein
LKAVNATASFVLAIVLALTAAMGIAAAVEAPPSLMSRADRLAGVRQIERETNLALARCRGIEDDAQRSLCRAQARADQVVAMAALEAHYRGTIAAHARIRDVRERAAHSVQMARRLLPT